MNGALCVYLKKEIHKHLNSQIPKTLQILTTQPNTENAANTHNTTKYRKHCKYSQHNQIQKTLQILTTQPNTENAANTHISEKPGGDAAGKDALHSAGVEGSEDSGAHSKLPQPSQEEETLMCLLQHCICVSRPCEILSDVNAEELKAAHPLHRCLVDGDGCVFSALSPVIHHQLLGLVDVE